MFSFQPCIQPAHACMNAYVGFQLAIPYDANITVTCCDTINDVAFQFHAT